MAIFFGEIVNVLLFVRVKMPVVSVQLFTRRDKIRNENIRKTVGVNPIMDYVDKQRVKWFGHLMRLPTEQPDLRAYRAGSSGTRAKGRPTQR